MKWSKNQKENFLFSCVRPPETPLCWQNTEEVTPRLYSRSILHDNKGFIWSISIAAKYGECTVTQKQVPHPESVAY